MRIGRQRPGAILEIPLGPWVDGINEKKEAGVLTTTELRAAANVLFDEIPGQATKANGAQQVALMPTGEPARFGYRYIKSDGTENLLVSDGESIYVTADLVTFTLLISGLDATAYMSFETADGRVWITNGTDATMWYDGTNFVVMDREYGNATAATTGAGTDQTHIVDAALTQANDYWNNRKVVITSGTYAGMEGTVTDFVAATDTLVISGFDNDPGVGVTYMVGLIMPKGKIIRYDGVSLLIGATSENRAAVQFNRIDDPDTGEAIAIDNPRAWPNEYQISITQDDGDQVWSFSPRHRDRVLVTKSSAIYRLEQDPVYIYRAVLVSQEVGCRYQDSWAVKDDLLHFMGNERSGQLDLYVTDMTSVKPRHKDGRLMPSFEGMYRAEPVYRYIARANADQFNTGEKSTLCKTDLGKLECRELDSKSDWTGLRVASTDISTDDQEGALTIQGLPAWPQKYEANELPAAASPVWTLMTPGYSTGIIENGKLKSAGATNVGYYKTGVYDSSKNTLVSFRIKNVGAATWFFFIGNGLKGATITFTTAGRILFSSLAGPNQDIGAIDLSAYKIIAFLLDKDGKISIHIDGLKTYVLDAPNAVNPYFTANSNVIGFIQATTAGTEAYLDFLYEDSDLSLNTTTYPATIPTTGNIELKLDYTRAPEAFGKIWLTLGNDFEGTTATGTDATHIVDATLTGEDDFWNGRKVTITSGARNGDTGTVSDYDSATHKLTITGLAGDPGVGVTFQIDRAGTVGIETSSSADDVTYNAYAALANGQEPAVDNATALAQYLKIRLTLTRADYVNGPEVDKLIAGFLWRMQAALVGANIISWRNVITETTIPTGAALVTKMRLATTATTPAEADWGAWKTFTTGQNIGTVLTDVPPPAAGESRWLDVKVEGGPTAGGESPNLENLLLNWQEGANTRLLLTALVYKKRYYLTGLSSDSEYNNRLYVLDTMQAWTKFIGLPLNRMVSFRGLTYGFSAVDDKIYQLEVEGKYSYGSTAIDAYVDTGAIDGGNQRFELADVKVGHAGGICTIEVLQSYDNSTWTSLGSMVFTEPGTKILRVPRGYIGKRHYLRLRSAGAEALAINMAAARIIAMPEEL